MPHKLKKPAILGRCWKKLKTKLQKIQISEISSGKSVFFKISHNFFWKVLKMEILEKLPERNFSPHSGQTSIFRNFCQSSEKKFGVHVSKCANNSDFRSLHIYKISENRRNGWKERKRGIEVGRWEVGR
jgi:hypothetical protein